MFCTCLCMFKCVCMFGEGREKPHQLSVRCQRSVKFSQCGSSNSPKPSEFTNSFTCRSSLVFAWEWSSNARAWLQGQSCGTSYSLPDTATCIALAHSASLCTKSLSRFQYWLQQKVSARTALRTTQPRAILWGDVHHLPLTQPGCKSPLWGGSGSCHLGNLGRSRDADTESTGWR